MKAIEIEIDGSRNENLLFRPLQKTIRGTFELNRISEPMARLKSAEFPIPIPGQRLGVDQDGCGYLVEPLHDEEHAPLRKKIEKEGMKLEPALVEFEDIHQPSWLFWIKRAVESGLAKITKGRLPDKIDGKPRLNWITAEVETSSTDKLTQAIEKQNILFERLIKKIGEGLE